MARKYLVIIERHIFRSSEKANIQEKTGEKNRVRVYLIRIICLFQADEVLNAFLTNLHDVDTLYFISC